MISVFTALLLGLLMILDPCTLFTSIAAIGYIDRELQNRRRVLITGGMFVLGKLVTYLLISVPFLFGAEEGWLHHLIEEWGETLLAAFMLVCGVLLLVSGHHHHDHDHGVNKWLQSVDEKSSWLWAFMLGIFFAIAFCPHRLMYFFTMIELTLTLPATWNWVLPLAFGLGTGLPILILAWAISYSAISTQTLTQRLHRFEHWIRYSCAILFIGYGLYEGYHLLGDGHHHGHSHPVSEQYSPSEG